MAGEPNAGGGSGALELGRTLCQPDVMLTMMKHWRERRTLAPRRMLDSSIFAHSPMVHALLSPHKVD